MSAEITLKTVLDTYIREYSKTVGTSIPGHIVAFEPATQLAQLQIGIKLVATDESTHDHAPIIECPVQFSGGSNFHIEHELNAGDEGLIVFSQRCMDAWIDTGGIAENPLLRFHDVNDAVFIPGVRSQPNARTAFENEGVRLTSAAGDQYVWLRDGAITEIKATTIKIIGNIEHTGNTTQTGHSTSTEYYQAPAFNGSGGTGTMSGMSSVATDEATINGINHSSHTHGGVQTGSGSSGGPQ